MESFENAAEQKAAELNRIANSVEDAALELGIAGANIKKGLEEQEYGISQAIGTLENALNMADREADPNLISSLRGLLDDMYSTRSQLVDAAIRAKDIESARTAAGNSAAYLRESAQALPR